MTNSTVHAYVCAVYMFKLSVHQRPHRIIHITKTLLSTHSHSTIFMEKWSNHVHSDLWWRLCSWTDSAEGESEKGTNVANDQHYFGSKFMRKRMSQLWAGISFRVSLSKTLCVYLRILISLICSTLSWTLIRYLATPSRLKFSSFSP